MTRRRRAPLRSASRANRMLFLVAALVGVVLGYVFGGRVANLVSLRFKWTWLLLVGLIVQLLIFPLFSNRPFVPYGTVPLHVLSYVAVFAFLILNLRARALLILGSGALLNFGAIAVNGGRMPASVTALERAGHAVTAESLISTGSHANILLMGESTRLNLLGDWLYLPKWIPFAAAFSIGDLLIMIGLAWLVVEGMRRRV